MTFLVERLADLRGYLEHLRSLRPRVSTADDLKRNLSLRNDVLFSLLSVCQLVIDIAGELSARKGLRFQDYTEAIRNLSAYDEFSEPLVNELERLPGFRNVLIHEYVALDLERAVEALEGLAPIAEFIEIVAGIEDDR